MTPTGPIPEKGRETDIPALAARIERALHNDRMDSLDDTMQNIMDRQWLAARYRQLRITHQWGFQGANQQTKTEWLELVLKGEL